MNEYNLWSSTLQGYLPYLKAIFLARRMLEVLDRACTMAAHVLFSSGVLSIHQMNSARLRSSVLQ